MAIGVQVSRHRRYVHKTSARAEEGQEGLGGEEGAGVVCVDCLFGYASTCLNINILNALKIKWEVE